MTQTIIIVTLLIFIILNQKEMSSVLADITENVTKALGIVTNIEGDIKSLDAKIAALPESPSVEEIEALKQLSADLVKKLSDVDALTPDAVVAPPVETPPTV